MGVGEYSVCMRATHALARIVVCELFPPDKEIGKDAFSGFGSATLKAHVRTHACARAYTHPPHLLSLMESPVGFGVASEGGRADKTGFRALGCVLCGRWAKKKNSPRTLGPCSPCPFTPHVDM